MVFKKYGCHWNTENQSDMALFVGYEESIKALSIVEFDKHDETKPITYDDDYMFDSEGFFI